MFTGIITDIGRILAVEQRGDLRARIATAYPPAGIAIGASIACDGVCLTVVATGQEDDEGAGVVTGSTCDVSAESLARTNLGRWVAGARGQP